MVIDKMSDGIPCTECQTICKKLNRKKDITITLENKLNLNDKAKKCQTELIEAVNALLNVKHGKGGYILIHATDSGYLDGFDQQVDPRLHLMIPRGTFYDKYFRRYIAADGKHIVFEVLRQDEEQPLSFVNFHSKVSLNSCTAELTRDQLQTAFEMVSKAESPVEEDSKPKQHKKGRFMQNLAQGKEMMCKKVPFVENLAMQAKCAYENKNKKLLEKITDSETVVGELWNGSTFQLVHYITAFSKLPGGGLFYFGVKEKTEGKLKRFVCNGFAFEEKQREEIEDAIAHRMKTNMLWVGKFPPPKKLVTVKLHPVSIETSPPPKGNEQKRHGQQPQLQQQNQDNQQHLEKEKEEKMKQDKPQQHQPDQNQSKQQPQQKIDDEMKPKQATESISDVATHGQKGSEHIPAQRRSPLYILEIKVEHYAHGVLFHNKMGPDIFKVCDKSGQPTRMSITDWVKAHDPSLMSSIFTH